jgi:membrane-bound serine protease (ClpP class)
MSALVLALLALGACLLLVEAAAPGVGIPGVAGIVSIVAGVALLVGDAPGPSVPVLVAVPALVTGAGAVALGVRHLLRAQRSALPTSGAAALLGSDAIVRRRAGGPPQGFVAGAWWALRSASGTPLDDGDRVWVVDVDVHRLELVVEALPPLPPPSSAPEGNPS